MLYINNFKVIKWLEDKHLCQKALKYESFVFCMKCIIKSSIFQTTFTTSAGFM
jgi:hypothetical protein